MALEVRVHCSLRWNAIHNQLADNFFFAITLIYGVDIIVRWYGLGFRSFKANGWNIFDVIVAFGAFVTTVIIRLESESFIIAQLQKLFLVSIAFKLVQRTNSLNQLFKTAVYVLFFVRTVFIRLKFWAQCEFTGDPESACFVVHLVFVFRHSLRRGL